MQLCEPGLIDKTRYLVKSGQHTFEVDEFYGENEGLVIAEVELGSEDEPYEKPDFIGKEVTGDRRYYNSYLRAHPFTLLRHEFCRFPCHDDTYFRPRLSKTAHGLNRLVGGNAAGNAQKDFLSLKHLV